jgi:molybdenum cofactor synthesis domain-containing protein
MTNNPTACVLLIGNEILSGRTQDANLNYLATKLGAAGIPVREARVIPDVPETIINTVNECRAKYTYVFTTGGIGPTHDDITSECVGRAFGRSLEINPQAMAALKAHYDKQGVEINAARARMATVPVGCELIDNPVSGAPGFRLENVFVMAGVPKIMQAMLDMVMPKLQGGPPVVMRIVTCEIREGDLAAELEAIQHRFPQVDIGSYPNMRAGRFITQLICKSSDAAAVEAANSAVVAMVQKLGGVAEVA